MTPAQLEIARRIVEAPSFRWMEGMRLTDGRIITRAHRWGVLLVAQWDEAQRHVEPGLVDLSTEPVDPLLAGPATDGCLHWMACERYDAAQIEARLDIAPRMTGASGSWRAVDGRGRRLSGGPIPTDILDALPDHPHTAAVCAALLHEVK